MWGNESDKRQFGGLWPLVYGDDAAARDYKLAVRHLLALADRGYAPAQFSVAMAYFDGKGVRRDYAESFRYCLAAAEADYPEAANMVGGFYASVTPKYKGCPHDPEEAVRWFRRAAERGNAGAQVNLATSYSSGNGIGKDPLEAYVWASLAVHCSSVRIRPAEVLRDQAAAELDAGQMETARARLSKLSGDLPLPWSTHLLYWKSLAKAAGVVTASPESG